MKLLLGPRRCRKKYIVCRLTDTYGTHIGHFGTSAKLSGYMLYVC